MSQREPDRSSKRQIDAYRRRLLYFGSLVLFPVEECAQGAQMHCHSVVDCKLMRQYKRIPVR